MLASGLESTGSYWREESLTQGIVRWCPVTRTRPGLTANPVVTLSQFSRQNFEKVIFFFKEAACRAGSQDVTWSRQTQ